MPPAFRNHLVPIACGTPAATAASSLAKPDAMAAQNRRRSSRPATGGRPGDNNGGRPDRAERRFRLVIATSSFKVLRRPVEFTQYVSIRYTERLADAGIEPSVGSVGDSYDNALAETVIGLFKTEVIRRCGPWRNVDAVEFATLEWVDWFNNRRRLEPIGNIPPAEAEARYYEQLNDLAMAARPKQNSLRQTRRGSAAVFERLEPRSGSRRSCRSCRTSRRRRTSSSASADAEIFSRPPVLPPARTAQLPIDCAVGSNSRASSSGSRPMRTRSTI